MLEWNVYYHDWNHRELAVFNVFAHGSFYDECKKNARKNIHDYDAFCKQLNRDAMYWYWSKCEWEIILAPWVGGGNTKEIKVDVYD